MQETCGNIKTILADLQGRGLSSTAKLVAILEACGVTDKDDLAAMLEIGGSTLRTAKAALKNERSKTSSARNQVLENEQNARNQAETLENERSNSSVPSRAHATKESLRDTCTYEVSKIPPTPQTRAEDVHFAHGRLEVGGRFEKFWLNEFGGDEDRLRLALIEIGGRIQPHGSRPLEAQVSSQLARIVADKRDRDKRYQAAAQVNRQATPKRLDMSKFVLVDCEPVS